MPAAQIDPTTKTFKRRGAELKTAAATCADEDSRALLLFYAAECLLKALYMKQNGLRTAEHSTTAATSARSFVHRLDSVIRALKIPPKDVPSNPGALTLRDGSTLEVQQLHQAWRYGEKADRRDEICDWLRLVASYALARL